MTTSPRPSLAESFAAACEWWRDAGVDQLYNDNPEALLKAPDEKAGKEQAAAAQPVSAEPPAPEPKMGGPAESWPHSLDGFTRWWLAEPSLDAGGTMPRIAPRGQPGADLMVLVTMPEADDRDLLLSGSHGDLLANMLRAMGIAPDKSYIASALPRHTPLADWNQLHRAGLGDILLHHVALVDPARILVLGRDILRLFGADRRQTVGTILAKRSRFSYLSTFGPGELIENPRLRAHLWRRWLDWTRDGK